MNRTPRGHIALALLGLALGAGCTSRTIPLPPPAIDEVSAPVDGLVTVRGSALEGASVGILNEDRMAGVITTSPETGCRECPFEAQIEAEAGDHLRAWQFRETSNPRDLQVPEP